MIMVSTKTCMQHDSKWVQKINPNQQRTTLKVKHNQCIHIPMKLPRGHSESGLDGVQDHRGFRLQRRTVRQKAIEVPSNFFVNFFK